MTSPAELFATLVRRASAQTHRHQRATELDDELAFHAELLERELRAGGMSERDARDAATRQLGNRTRIQEEARDSWSLALIDDTLRHLRLAFRAARSERWLFAHRRAHARAWHRCDGDDVQRARSRAHAPTRVFARGPARGAVRARSRGESAARVVSDAARLVAEQRRVQRNGVRARQWAQPHDTERSTVRGGGLRIEGILQPDGHTTRARSHVRSGRGGSIRRRCDRTLARSLGAGVRRRSARHRTRRLARQRDPYRRRCDASRLRVSGMGAALAPTRTNSRARHGLAASRSPR